MSFEILTYAWLLAIIPILIAMYFLHLRYNQELRRKLSDSALYKRLLNSSINPLRTLPFVLFLFFVACAILALMNPRIGTISRELEQEQADIVLALDISRSMLAEDIAPNRLEIAKEIAIDIAKKLRSERVGLILFAGNAYLQSPLTQDIAAIEIFIRSSSPAQATTQGSSIANAIDLAQYAFGDEKQGGMSMIVISDGEAHDTELESSIDLALEKGLIIHTVGVGTQEGGYIPLRNSDRQDFVRDQEGQLVKTRLEDESLRELARATGGVHLQSSNIKQIGKEISVEIDRMEKTQIGSQMFTEYNQYFAKLAFAALICYFLSLISGGFSRLRMSKEKILDL